MSAFDRWAKYDASRALTPTPEAEAALHASEAIWARREHEAEVREDERG